MMRHTGIRFGIVAAGMLLGPALVVPPRVDALVLCVREQSRGGRTVTESFFRNDRCPRKFFEKDPATGEVLVDPITNEPVAKAGFQQLDIPGDFLCWDRQPPNGLCDLADDINGDGVCTSEDCRAPECWDLDGNLGCDRGAGAANEDINGDGACTMADCRAPACWDLDANLRCDPAEDVDGRDGCTLDDCRAPECWDLDADLRCDVSADPNANEDLNGDGRCSVADCQGFACWDRDANLRCDPAAEDVNGDGACTIADCRGAPCWDANQNLRCDVATEDVTGDGACSTLDCRMRLDLTDDGVPDDVALTEIATIGDADGVFSVSTPGTLVIDARRSWPRAEAAAALAADPPACASGTFAMDAAADGTLDCAPLTDADVPDDITVRQADRAMALGNDPGDCGPNAFATGIDSAGNLGCRRVGAPDLSGTLGFADLAGVVTDAQIPDDITIARADAAVGLTGDPADCGPGAFATGIDARGNLGCRGLGVVDLTGGVGFIDLAGTATDAQIPDDITVTRAATADTATALASDPAGCPPGTFATDAGADGTLGCAAVTAADVGDLPAVAIDADGDGVDEVSMLRRIRAAGDRNGVIVATSADEVTIDLGRAWPAADTAGALATEPADCGPGSFATGIDARGNLGCRRVAAGDLSGGIGFTDLAGTATDAQIPDDITVNRAGTAATAAALASDPAACPPGTFAADVAADGSLSCAAVRATDIANLPRVAVDLGADGTDDATALARIATTGDANDIFATDAAATLLIDVDQPWPLAERAVALESDPADCGPGAFATGIDAGGNLGCRRLGGGDLPGAVSFADLAGTASDAQIPDDITVTRSASAGTADTAVTATFATTATSATIATSAATAAALASDPAACANGTFVTDMTASGVLGCASLTDAVIPDELTVNRARTALALAADPGPCALGQFVRDIASNGALSCQSLNDTIVPDDITVNVARTATALAADPVDCPAGEFAIGIDASGNLSCARTKGPQATALSFKDMSGAATDAQVPDDISIEAAGIAGGVRVGSDEPVETPGEIAIDDDVGQLVANPGDGRPTIVLDPRRQHSIVVRDPASAGAIALFRAFEDITVVGVDCIVDVDDDENDRVSIAIEARDASGRHPRTIERIECGNAGASDDGVDAPLVDAGAWVGLDVARVASDGAANNVTVTLTYTVNRASSPML
jgi:hypothetical protein